jgi:hypothetical protein
VAEPRRRGWGPHAIDSARAGRNEARRQVTKVTMPDAAGETPVRAALRMRLRPWTPRLQQVSATRRLGAYVKLVVAIGRKSVRHPLLDGDAAARQPLDFRGIVGQQSDAREPELS